MVKDIELKELRGFLENQLDKTCYFTCYVDKQFVYELPFLEEDALTGLEICVGADDIFECTESLRALFDKDDIKYFGVAEYKKGVRITDTFAYRPLIREE